MKDLNDRASGEPPQRLVVGVRELRAGAARILRRVHDKHETVDVTYRGQVIARIVPVPPPTEATDTQIAVWMALNQLAGEIGRHWRPKGKSAAEAISEGRER